MSLKASAQALRKRHEHSRWHADDHKKVVTAPVAVSEQQVSSAAPEPPPTPSDPKMEMPSPVPEVPPQREHLLHRRIGATPTSKAS
jgi:hypothetical protein